MRNLARLTAAAIKRENSGGPEPCDCGHKRMSHAGASPHNNGGNQCWACKCPLYQPAARVKP